MDHKLVELKVGRKDHWKGKMTADGKVQWWEPAKEDLMVEKTEILMEKPEVEEMVSS
jgi:hypothetical protein